jgi:phage shock protein PspC (stress-responsive transcriptional regulator)
MTATTHPNVDLADNSLAGARAWFAQKGLARPREGRVLAGVAAGFARRYDINPLVARLGAIASVLVLSPIVYIAA